MRYLTRKEEVLKKKRGPKQEKERGTYNRKEEVLNKKM